MKKMVSIFGLILMATTAVYAQNAVKPATAVKPEAKPPVLSEANLKTYFKADDEYQKATAVLLQKQNQRDAAAKALIADCGTFLLTQDAQGDLVCVVAPKPEAKK